MAGRTGIDDTRSAAGTTSRRSLGQQDDLRLRPRPSGRRAAPPPARRPEPSKSTPSRRAGSRVLLSALVMAFAAAIVATMALPSYAIDPAQTGDVGGRSVTKSGQQQFQVPGAVEIEKLDRDSFKATSSAALLRAAYAQQFSAYNGPSAADYLKNPAHPDFSLSAVFNTALQYQGVPYVFGGADPSGFDCSGFVMFVYAQYGVSLPHSVHQQDQIGTTISEADAQPGDVVVFNDDSHDGFYAGNGMILHAPVPGERVRVQKLWTNDVHFVRFGI